MDPRIVCRFSCGAASAVATKIILSENDPARVLIVNAFVQEEHEDNRRFLADCERWFNHPITVLRDEKYGASTHEVWRKKRYMKGREGAPCSGALKRTLLNAISREDDINILGFTSEEADRLDDIREAFPAFTWDSPLVARGLKKADCLAIVDRAGIEIPFMYRRGYDNANCIGCPKGGQNYWQAIREDFPEQFHQIKTIQEGIGPGAYFLRFRSGPRKEERMSLADLPPGRGNMADEPNFSCSFFCEIAEQDIMRGKAC